MKWFNDHSEIGVGIYNHLQAFECGRAWLEGNKARKINECSIGEVNKLMDEMVSNVSEKEYDYYDKDSKVSEYQGSLDG